MFKKLESPTDFFFFFSLHTHMSICHQATQGQFPLADKQKLLKDPHVLSLGLVRR